MLFNKKKKEEKQFIENVKFPNGFEGFLKEHYNKQQEADIKIEKEIAKTPMKLENFMVQDDFHKLFMERYFTASPLDKIIRDIYPDSNFGTTFYLIYYGFTFYNPFEIRKIALNFMPSKKLIPFAINGHDSTDGVLCLDYSENEIEPSIMFIDAQTNSTTTVAETFKEFLEIK